MFSDITKKVYPLMFSLNSSLGTNYYQQHEACTKKAAHSLERVVALDRTTLSQLAEPGDDDTAGSLRENSFGFG